MLFLTQDSAAQTTAEAEEYPVEFKIQVAASGKPLSKLHKIYQDLTEVEEVDLGDGYYRYYVGKFHTFHEAKDYNAEKVRAKGYMDAYVVGFHLGKRVTVEEAISIIYKD